MAQCFVAAAHRAHKQLERGPTLCEPKEHKKQKANTEGGVHDALAEEKRESDATGGDKKSPNKEYR